ncbi:MAG: amidohydrolase [Woeseiaceae bacterium]|nr:amidohydrolase [Woeseiaceae bacterium]
MSSKSASFVVLPSTRQFMWGFFAACLLYGAVAAQTNEADTIFVNARVYTVEKRQPWADAFALSNGRFSAVGSRAEVEKLKGKDTKIIDLGGRFVMPGFNDAHSHPLRSQLFIDVDLELPVDRVLSVEEFSERVKAFADANPDREWLIGAAFTYATFADTPINAALMDTIIPDRPIIIEDETGHVSVANSKALELAGITKDTPDPVGGYFGRNEDGTPNGLLYETAMQEVFRFSPNYTLEQVTAAGAAVFPRMHALGITGVKLAQGDHIWAEALQTLDRRGALDAQLSMVIYEVDFYRQYSNAELIRNHKLYESDNFRIDGVKLFIDGVVFGQTMLVKEAYLGTDNYGLPATPPDVLRDKIVKYNGMGLHVMVHSTGDRGGEIVLEGTEMAMAEHGVEAVRALRNQIAHSMIVDPADYDRMKYANVVVEFSPAHWYPSPITNAALDDLGPERLQDVWPFGLVQRADINVAIGSDYKDSKADPLLNTETLVTRRAPGAGEDDPILGADSAADLDDVLYAYTMGGAYAMFMEDEIGSIRPGKRANFIVLDRNLFEIPRNEIHKAIVRETWFEGRKVYEGTKKVSF